MKELHLSHLKQTLKFKTECDDGLLKQIEEYINDKYSEHKLEEQTFSSLEISNLLLVNAVYEILSLKEKEDKDRERMSSIVSRLP